jgi:hypothetical protein
VLSQLAKREADVPPLQLGELDAAEQPDQCLTMIR